MGAIAFKGAPVSKTRAPPTECPNRGIRLGNLRVILSLAWIGIGFSVCPYHAPSSEIDLELHRSFISTVKVPNWARAVKCFLTGSPHFISRVNFFEKSRVS